MAQLDVIPAAARLAFAAGDDRAALAALRRARDDVEAHSVSWAVLERLVGLMLIRLGREVEGTFALERADALLERTGEPEPDLGALEPSSP